MCYVERIYHWFSNLLCSCYRWCVLSLMRSVVDGCTCVISDAFYHIINAEGASLSLTICVTTCLVILHIFILFWYRLPTTENSPKKILLGFFPILINVHNNANCSGTNMNGYQSHESFYGYASCWKMPISW